MFFPYNKGHLRCDLVTKYYHKYRGGLHSSPNSPLLNSSFNIARKLIASSTFSVLTEFTDQVADHTHSFEDRADDSC